MESFLKGLGRMLNVSRQWGPGKSLEQECTVRWAMLPTSLLPSQHNRVTVLSEFSPMGVRYPLGHEAVSVCQQIGTNEWSTGF